MALFYYKARDGKGRHVEGKKEAAHLQQALTVLREEGYFVITITEREPGLVGLKKSLQLSARPVNNGELAIFCRQLAVMQEAGIPLMNGLKLLTEQTGNKVLKQALGEIIRDVSAGKTLSEAAEGQDKVFNTIFVSMVAAGEMGGALDEVLIRLAEHYEREQQVREKIKTAMIYPLAIVCVAFLTIVLLMTVVLPRFVRVLESLNAPLPASTRIIMQISALASHYWYFLLPGLVLLVLLGRQWGRSPAGRRLLNSLLLALPGFGRFTKNVILARFTRTLGTLLKTGVQIMPALEIMGKVVDNPKVAAEIAAARQAVQDGQSLASPLLNSPFFPPMVVQMMQVGEETGNLDQLLVKVSVFYEREVDEMSERLSKLIEPVLLLVLGGIIGLILYSVLMPMFSVITSIG